MANRQQIIVSKEDHARLESLLASEFAAVCSDEPHLKSLRGELNIAKVVPAEQVPPNVVTMNSSVRLREIRTRETETYTLVFPEHADIANDKLSVLAPIGTAILGYQVGDIVDWNVPSGSIRFKIEELVFQPQRDGALA